MDPPAPLDLLHDPVARIPHSGRRCPSIPSELRVAHAQVLLGICSGPRQGAQKWCRRWGQCTGVGSALLRTHILWPVTQGCIPGESDGIERENWDVLPRPGARMTATVALCHAGVCRQSRTKSDSKPGLTQKGNGEQPFLEGIPGLSSARPADLGQDRVGV